MGCFFDTQYNESLSSLVSNFKILSQVIAEESLTVKKRSLYKSDRKKNGKNKEKRKQNED